MFLFCFLWLKKEQTYYLVEKPYFWKNVDCLLYKVYPLDVSQILRDQ